MSESNPYEPPKTPHAAKSPRFPVGKTILGVVLLMALIPASGIAFFTCCLVGLELGGGLGRGPQGEAVPLLMGAVGGIITFGGILYAFIRLTRSSDSRPIPEPGSDSEHQTAR